MAAFALPLAFALSACAGGSSGGGSAGSAAGGATGSGAPAGPSGPTPLPLTWLKGDLHNHTTYSTSIRFVGDDPAKCLELAEAAGLDFWCMTDHRNTDGKNDPGLASSRLIVITGEEWGNRSHAGTIGLQRDIVDKVDQTQPASTWNAQVQAVIDDVHAQGGLFVVNHPTNQGIPWVWDVQDVDAVEVWNAFWALHATSGIDTARLQRETGTALLNAGHAPMAELVQVSGSTADGAMGQALRFYEALLTSGRRVACVGGGDRHMLTWPGEPTTHVGTLSQDVTGVLEGIRRGRTYVTAQPDGPIVEFAADQDGDGVYETLMGEEVPKGVGVDLLVRIRNTPGGRIDLRRSGQTIATVEALTDPIELRFSDTPLAGDWYRVDFYEPIDTGILSGTAVLALAMSPTLQAVDWHAPSTYVTLMSAIASIPALRLDDTFDTRLPLLTLPREYSRLVNADPRDARWSVAALTSAIYVAP